MISLRDLSAGIYGAWRLAHFDPQGLRYFDSSDAGFWRSFWAAVIAAPAYALVVALNLGDGDPPVNLARLVLIEGIAYVMGWTAFPLAMAGVAQKLGRGHHFTRYIVACNWCGVIEMTAFLPAVAIGAAIPGLSILPALVALALFGYQWYVARLALDVSPVQAVLPVALNFLLGLVISLVARVLILSGSGMGVVAPTPQAYLQTGPAQMTEFARVMEGGAVNGRSLETAARFRTGPASVIR
ncbi:MAG TPA: hypothetical protein VGO34_13020 [Alphaproteobacteria bacterium]|jgi:hypothetical protein